MAAGIRKVGDDAPRSKPHVERHARRLRKFQEIFEGESGGDDDTEKRVDHHASTIADLLVESGRFPHRTAALDHLLNSPHGNALLARLHKAADQTAKESNMRSETLESILKDSSPVSVCKAIVDRGRSPCGEQELVAALTKRASELHPELTEAQAFAELYKTESVWRACQVAKSQTLDVMMVGGVAATHEAINNTEQSEAYQQLVDMAEKLRAESPFLSADQAFAKVFEDPKHAAIAAKAHRRPSATTSYEFPR
jgi:hypothetical protein